MHWGWVTMNTIPKKEQFLHHYMPYVSAYSDDILILRDGDMMASVEVEGLTATMSDDREIDALMRNFNTMLQSLNPRCGIYVHKIISNAESLTSKKVTGNVFAKELNDKWYTHLSNVGLKRKRIIVSFCIRPNIGSVRATALLNSLIINDDQRNDGYKKLADDLNSIVTHFKSVIAPQTTKHLKLSDGSMLGFLGKLIGRKTNSIKPSQTCGPITEPLVSDRYKFVDDTFVIQEQGNHLRYGRVISIKNYCHKSWSDFLDRIDMPMDMVITNSYTPCSSNKALKLFKNTKAAMDSVEDERETDKQKLREAAEDVASRVVGFGKHHLAITIFQDTKDQLDELTSVTRASCEEVGLTMVNEAKFAKEQFFAQFPGNYNCRVRKEYIPSKVFTNFAALHTMPKGRGDNDTPWENAVTHFSDITGSPYSFNFHEQWNKGREPSPGHSVMVGSMGSGKSTLAAFLAAQSIRAGARVYVFDKDNALEMAVRAFGGKYTNLLAGQSTGLNPFATETDKEGISWLGSWLETLLLGEKEFTPLQSKRIFDVLKDNASAPDSLKNFDGFTPEFVSLDDDSIIHERLLQWCSKGQFGWAFATEDEKSFALDDHIMGFDFTELLDKPRFRSPILAYILRLIERSIKDREPTLIIIDEAWKMLDDPYFVKMLKEWMVTMRKKNVVVLMMSLSLIHI